MSVLKIRDTDGNFIDIPTIKGEDGAIQYTAGEGIKIENNIISALAASGFVISLTEDIGNGTYTADKSYAEIRAAYDSNKNLMVLVDNSILPLMNAQVANRTSLGLTFGYTNVQAGGALVNTRAINYLYTDGTESWEDSDVSGEYLPVNSIFRITFTHNEVAGLDADRTISEISEAISNNYILIGTLDNNKYSLIKVENDKIVFGNVIDNISYTITYQNNTWTLTTTNLLDTHGYKMAGNIDMDGNSVTNIQKLHVDGAAPLYIGSTIESAGTTGSRITGTTSGEVAVVKADKQAEYVPFLVGTPTNANHAATKEYVDTIERDYLTKITGYDATATQVLKNVNGTISWVTEN